MPERATIAQRKYDEANTTRIQLKLNNRTDADILERLNSMDSKQGYIKECIRKDMSGYYDRVDAFLKEIAEA